MYTIITFSKKDVQHEKIGGGLDVESGWWERQSMWLTMSLSLIDFVACILHPFITCNWLSNPIFDGNAVSNNLKLITPHDRLGIDRSIVRLTGLVAKWSGHMWNTTWCMFAHCIFQPDPLHEQTDEPPTIACSITTLIDCHPWAHIVCLTCT